jgi:hypothetical protein
VWDPREKKNPKRIMLHVNKEGKGAVSSICGGGIRHSGDWHDEQSGNTIKNYGKGGSELAIC